MITCLIAASLTRSNFFSVTRLLILLLLLLSLLLLSTDFLWLYIRIQCAVHKCEYMPGKTKVLMYSTLCKPNLCILAARHLSCDKLPLITTSFLCENTAFAQSFFFFDIWNMFQAWHQKFTKYLKIWSVRECK